MSGTHDGEADLMFMNGVQSLSEPLARAQPAHYNGIAPLAPAGAGRLARRVKPSASSGQLVLHDQGAVTGHGPVTTSFACRVGWHGPKAQAG